MKSKAILCALAIAPMGFASLSSAQGAQGAQGQGPGYQNGPGPGFSHRDSDRRDAREARQERREDRRDARQDLREQQYGARGPQFYRGGRMPQQYRSHQYVVNDWRSHRLSSPPRGQQWV